MIVFKNCFQRVSKTLVILTLLFLTLHALPVFAQNGSVATAPTSANKLLIHDADLMERSMDRPSTFIVGLAAGGSQVERLADELREDYGLVVHKIWNSALVGLLVESDLATAKLLASDDRVRFVEQNAPIAGPRFTEDLEPPTELEGCGSGPPNCYDASAPQCLLNPYPASTSTISWGPGCPGGSSCTGNWGIGRIDDRLPGGYETYQPVSGPNLVDVFIIDLPVNLNHEELSQNPVDEVFIGREAEPYSHGTHVAGILAGKNFGVAQDNIRFHAVNLFYNMSTGRPPWIDLAQVVTGFELVMTNRVAGVPAVVSLSFNSPELPSSPTASNVVRRVIAEGISVVNSAGNLNTSSERPLSCDDATSPGELAENHTLTGPTYPGEVLVVGATNDQDRVYCDCDRVVPPEDGVDCGSRLASPGKIDLFAPGADIVSMATSSPTAICRLSGTSMAAPHVAGAAALLLSRFPEASPRAIQYALKRMATWSRVRDHNGDLVGHGPLLYVGDDFTDDQPVAGFKWYFARAGETLSIPKSDLIRSSFDWEGRPLQLTAAYSPWKGQLVDQGAFVDFTVDANAPPSIDTVSTASFRFQVSNGVEIGTGQVHVVVEISQPPTAAISLSGSNLEYTFDGRGSTDDEGIVSYAWEFPDGTQKTGPVVSHFFPGYNSGNYCDLCGPVTLTVTDADGSTAEATVYTDFRYSQPNVTPRAGSWYNPDRSGHGISFYRNAADQYVLTWYTYLADGTPIWYLSDPVPKSKATWAANLSKVTWNGVSTTPTVVGTVKLEFDDSRDAWFSWTLNGVSGGERFRFFHGGGSAGGLWFPPSDSGWGMTVDDGYSNRIRTMVNAVTFYEDSQPRWVMGTADYSSNAYTPVYWHHGPGLCPSCGGSTLPTRTRAGSIRVEIPTPTSRTGFLSTSIITPSGLRWTKPRLPIQALTMPW